MKRPSSRGFDGHSSTSRRSPPPIGWLGSGFPRAKLRLRGRYAFSRYQSMNAYSDGIPTDALSDLATKRDPGLSTGSSRDARNEEPLIHGGRAE